jgi:hypothetical protein
MQKHRYVHIKFTAQEKQHALSYFTYSVFTLPQDILRHKMFPFPMADFYEK